MNYIHHLIYLHKLKNKAQNLLATDDNGVSDPFVVVNYYGVEKKTQVIDDTLNPVINLITLIIFFDIS